MQDLNLSESLFCLHGRIIFSTDIDAVSCSYSGMAVIFVDLEEKKLISYSFYVTTL